MSGAELTNKTSAGDTGGVSLEGLFNSWGEGRSVNVESGLTTHLNLVADTSNSLAVSRPGIQRSTRNCSRRRVRI